MLHIKKVYTIYRVLYKIKQLSHIILKINVKTVNKSHSSMPVTQAIAGNMCVTVEMVSGYCVLIYFKVLVYVVSLIMEYTISFREIRHLVNRNWHTVYSALLPKPLTAA